MMMKQIIYISEWLEKDYKVVYNQLRDALMSLQIPLNTLPYSKEVWCRDYMPVYIGSGQYVGKLYTVYYTQREGIALGSWKDGLSGFNFEDFSYSTKSVVLSFTGVPDYIQFDVYSQHLRSVGNVTGATGNYDATLRNWTLEESADGVNFSQVGEEFESPSDLPVPSPFAILLIVSSILLS